MATTTAAAPPPYVDPWALVIFTFAGTSPSTVTLARLINPVWIALGVGSVAGRVAPP
jgi:hypothetical protein